MYNLIKFKMTIISSYQPLPISNDFVLYKLLYVPICLVPQSIDI